MRYVVMHWNVHDEAACAAAAMARAACPADWDVVTDRPGFFAAAWFRRGTRGLAAVLDCGGVIIGRVFDRAATDAGEVVAVEAGGWGGGTAGEIATRLVARCWGAYVLIVPCDQATEIARDPLGALDCLTWRCCDVRIVASHIEPFIAASLPPPDQIDWTIVAAMIAAPVSAAETLALRQVDVVPPGTLCRAGGAHLSCRPVWRPAHFCDNAASTPADPRSLAAMIDACVAAWASCFDTAVAELSGGLDSAIVASALRAAKAPVTLWLNHYGDDAQADERTFARATAASLSLPLMEIARSQRPIDAFSLTSVATGVRPGMPGMDVHHDRDIATHALEQSAAAIFTGQGGDAVFFQMPTALVAADCLGPGAAWRGFPAAAIKAAAWTRSTVWATAREALAGGQALSRSRRATAPFIRARVPPAHVWLDGTDHLPPAKRLQIWGLANSRVYFIDSRRSQVSDMVHPLLSQPLVELALSLSVLQLTGGERDRQLARTAFAARLPKVVAQRHGKGDVTAYYGRLVAASAPFLREYLGAGYLAAAGLVDADRLAAVLELETLALEDWYTEILSAALVEAWLRHRDARPA